MPANFMYVKQQGLVNAFDLLDALEFVDQFVFYRDVNPVPTIEPNVLVLHRLLILELKWNSVPPQFMSQALFVGGFQQARP